MQIQKTSFETKDRPNNANKSKYSITILLIVGLCAFSIVGLFLIEMIPHYLIIPLSPPEDSYGTNWNSTTRSVWTIQSTPKIRVFIWRQDATLSYENTDDIPSWNSIVMYFSEHLSEHGWKQSDSSISCNAYLPEAAFLQFGENGFVSYHKSGNHAYSEETSADDVICLAVWNDEGDSNVFRIVMLTAKNSFFTNLFTVFEL